VTGARFGHAGGSVRDGSIADGAGLLRRVIPEWVVDDKNTGGKRLSSAAFKDPATSVDVEPMLEAAGLDWSHCLRNHPGYSLVRIRAATARGLGQAVVHAHIFGENEAHAEIRGKKTQGTANRLRDAAEWVFLAG
jgi:hypothetical protein